MDSSLSSQQLLHDFFFPFFEISFRKSEKSKSTANFFSAQQAEAQTHTSFTGTNASQKFCISFHLSAPFLHFCRLVFVCFWNNGKMYSKMRSRKKCYIICNGWWFSLCCNSCSKWVLFCSLRSDFFHSFVHSLARPMLTNIWCKHTLKWRNVRKWEREKRAHHLYHTHSTQKAVMYSALRVRNYITRCNRLFFSPSLSLGRFLLLFSLLRNSFVVSRRLLFHFVSFKRKKRYFLPVAWLSFIFFFFVCFNQAWNGEEKTWHTETCIILVPNGWRECQNR